jgi:hypothetical protein
MFTDYEHITCPVYSFNIEVVTGYPIKQDDRVRDTVRHIIAMFFEDIDNVAIYVCDSSDNKQVQRRRKFNIWFSGINDKNMSKGRLHWSNKSDLHI